MGTFILKHRLGLRLCSVSLNTSIELSALPEKLPEKLPAARSILTGTFYHLR